jgi:hypothetical protein
MTYLSSDEIHVGAVLWARARGYWREVRVVAKGRRGITVAYLVRATHSASASTKRQDIPWHRLRADRPSGHYGIIDVPAPEASA